MTDSFIKTLYIYLSVIFEHGCPLGCPLFYTHKWRIRAEIHKHLPYCNREQDTEEWYWGQQFA